MLIDICFNPRAREGRDRTWHRQFEGCRVSIHAPARGATDKGHIISYWIIVSIHAPARGATNEYYPEWTGCSFNPRAREGRDG